MSEHVFVAVAKRMARTEARRLRVERSMSLAQIAAELGVAKSSVSVWVRDLPAGGPLPEGAVPPVSGTRLPVWSSGRTQRCGRCGLTLPDVCFNRHGARRQWWCRECFRGYFRERGAKHLEQSGDAVKARRLRARRLLVEHVRASPCLDCGESDIVVLECDHVDGKDHAIAALVAAGAGDTALRAELARCEVVCVNCHRRRTAARAGWRRASPDWEASLTASGSREHRNLAHVYRHLATHPCTDCGTEDLVVLEFDHVGEKREMVTRMATTGHSRRAIDAEIAACEVVCANCHRRRTTLRGGHHRAATAPD